MYLFILIVHIFVSLVLVAVILLQAGRGGIAEAFGGGTTQSLFGTRTATFLTRATAVCATLFILTSLSLTVLSGRRSRSLMERVAPVAPLQTRPQPQPLPTVPLPPATQPAPSSEPTAEATSAAESASTTAESSVSDSAESPSP